MRFAGFIGVLRFFTKLERIPPCARGARLGAACARAQVLRGANFSSADLSRAELDGALVDHATTFQSAVRARGLTSI